MRRLTEREKIENEKELEEKKQSERVSYIWYFSSGY